MPAVHAHAAEGLGRHRAADRVERDVDARAERRVQHGVGETALAVVDRDVGAELAAERDLLGPAGGGDDRGAQRLAQLDRRRADPAGPGMNQQGLARLRAGPARRG